MRKVLGVLLALTIAVGAFAGLTLLSVSAASRSALVEGEYLFEDFENGTAASFNAPLGGTVEIVNKANGAPTYDGSDYSLKFSGGTGAWVLPGITSDAVTSVVQGRTGTYMLSAWIYVETMPSDNATTIQAIWRNNTDGNNAGFISGGKTIKQGEWAFVSFITELNSTWAAYQDLYVMFDTAGN